MKIVLIGDSIRLVGYGPMLEEELKKEGHEVFQPEDNCRFAQYTLRLLFDFQEQIKGADIIHFNTGLWDVCNINGDEYNFSPIEEYKFNLTRVVKWLLKVTPHVIFSTTTPVWENHPYNKNSDIEEYNRVAMEIMKENNVKVNDLYAIFKDNIHTYIREDDLIHLTEKGSKTAMDAILKCIHEEIQNMDSAK